MKFCLSLLLATFCFCSLPAQGEESAQPFDSMREWTSADGNSTFKGKVTKYDGKTARITPAGKANMAVALDKLSEADRTWLEENKDKINDSSQPAKTIDPYEPTTDMGKELQKSKALFGKKIRTGAQYYLVLCSASWCPPCRKEMPDVVKTYNEKISKDPNVELVHVSFDQDKASAKEWAKKEKMTFPAIEKDSVKRLPLIGAHMPSGIPRMYLYNGKGEVLSEGFPSAVLKNYEDKIKEQGSASDTSPDK